MEASTKMNKRRTLMYFHELSDVTTRAPHTRFPRPGKNRSALMFFGFSTSCSRFVTSCAILLMERITSLAGALWTPRSMSTRA